MLDLAKDFFIKLLQGIGASSLTLTPSLGNEIIGFECDAEEYIHELLKLLRIPFSLYKEKNHFLLFIQYEHLSESFRKEFHRLLNELRREGLPPISGFFDHTGNFIFDLQESYDLITADLSLITVLKKCGLICKKINYKERISIPYSYPSHTLPSELDYQISFAAGASLSVEVASNPDFGSLYTIHSELVSYVEKHQTFLHIENLETFFKMCGQELVNKALTNAARNTFMQGLFSKASSVSSLKNSTIFEAKLVPLLFSYLEPVEPQKEFKEKTEHSTFPEIEFARTRLLEESKGSWFFGARKKEKAQFLELIMNIKKTNPAFKNSTCVAIAIKQHPDLYQKAIKGYFSQRTFTLIQELKSLDKSEHKMVV